MTTTATAPKTSPAFMLQAGVAFAVALIGMVIGETMLPVSPWTRAFLAMGTVFLVSSAFTLAKVVRDQHESGNVVSRIDQARIDRLMAEFDPYHVPSVPAPNGVGSPGPSGPQPPVYPTHATAYPN